MLADTPKFIGLDTSYLTADQRRLTRVHMDSAASPLPAQAALDALRDFLPHYSNSHSVVHQSAKISTQALAWAHQQVLEYLQADSGEYTSVFIGAGTTAAINRIARGLNQARPEKNVVLVSAMEHHANDLPHRQFGNLVHYIPLTGEGADQGCIDLVALETLLIEHQGQVNYIAFSAVSNVTGIINPVAELIALAHKHDVLVVLDAAQAIAHQNFSLRDNYSGVDFLVFSGHKVYCPTAPGVMVAKRSLLSDLEGQDLGGGAVVDVSFYDFELHTSLPYKEQAGTPNIAGAVALAKVLQMLKGIGRNNIEKHSLSLIAELQQALESLPNIRIYGRASSAKLGAIAFNHSRIDHGLLSAILNDYFMIAVRNECFCAHPYVSNLLKEELWEIDLSEVSVELHQAMINRKRGMVRASLGAYNNGQDISYLAEALREIESRIEEFRPLYEALEDGNYRHKTFDLDWRQELGW